MESTQLASFVLIALPLGSWAAPGSPAFRRIAQSRVALARSPRYG
jgi:hypothetical protein